MRTVLFISAFALLVGTTSYATETVVKDTRLVQAAKIGDSASAVALLNKRVDPNIAEPDGTTALH